MRVFIVGSMLLAACAAPRLAPLPNAPPPSAQREPLPVIELPRHHQRIVFNWRLQEAELEVRGEGAARVAAPDSVRVDLFVAGGLGSGAAWVIGDEMRLDAPDALRKVLPPPAFLWAALGRFAIPGGRDTLVARTDSVITADIGPARAGASGCVAAASRAWNGPRVTASSTVSSAGMTGR